MTITAHDQKLLSCMFVYGTAGLLELGMTPQQVADFVARPEVVAAMRELVFTYNRAEEFDARRNFILKRELAKLGLSAVRILKEALRGPLYERTPEGLPLRDYRGGLLVRNPPPTGDQVDAAKDILNRLGVKADDESYLLLSDENVVAHLQKASREPLQIPYVDENSKMQQALMRERVRNAIMRLTPKIQDAHAASVAAETMNDRLVKLNREKTKQKRRRKQVISKVAES